MSLRRLSCVLLLLGCCCAPGCGWWGGEAATEDEELAEVLPGAEGALADGAADPALAPPNLSLNLKVGDRFPLLKTIVQNLTQPSPQGPVSSSSALEMLMSIAVQEVPEAGERQGQKLMAVKYHRVRFRQDLAGNRVDYDSQSPQYPLAVEAQGYHGLVGNGFYFWLGPNNQIVEMVGFREFLERCLKDVAPERQQQVRTVLAATSGADGIANFVDDSIGLLPPQAVQVGDSWTKTRQVFEPLRMYISNKYTLRTIDTNQAEVIIQGTIAPSASYGVPEPAARNVNVVVRGGRCDGTCLIDRRTGLPLQSRVEQTISMQVKFANEEFEQQKQTITTIRAFPEGGGPPEATAAVPQMIPSPPSAVTGSTGSALAGPSLSGPSLAAPPSGGLSQFGAADASSAIAPASALQPPASSTFAIPAQYQDTAAADKNARR